jgi:hypothetical protein
LFSMDGGIEKSYVLVLEIVSKLRPVWIIPACYFDQILSWLHYIVMPKHFSFHIHMYIRRDKRARDRRGLFLNGFLSLCIEEKIMPG